MEIKATTINNYETIKKYNKAFVYRNSRFYISIFVLLLFLGWTVFIIYASGDIIMSILNLFVFLFLLTLMLYRWFIKPKMRYKKSNTKLKDIRSEYVFTEDLIHLTSKTESYSGSAEIQYSVIQNVCETAEFIYLYVNKHTAYIVDKKNIENGTVLELRNLLISKLPAKKYKCTKELKDK